MTTGPGFFDERGNPCVKVHLRGVHHTAPGLEFSGILDTGFTGFIQLPIQHAFALGLPLSGTTSATLADGSQVTCLTALGETTFDNRMEVGAIILSAASEDILIGMDFLRQFKLGVLIGKGLVAFLDEDWYETLQAQQAKDHPPDETTPAKPDGG